jgi:rod shape-determining protein MreD
LNRRLHAGVLLAISVFAQVSFKDELVAFGVGPEPALICVFFVGLFGGDAKGTLYGAIGGLAIDAMSGGLLGLCASGYGLVGFFAGRLSMLMFDIGHRYGAMGLFFLSLTEGVYVSIIVITLVGGSGMAEMVIRQALPQAVYNMLIGAAVLWLVREDTLLRYRSLSFLGRWELVY